MKKFICLLLVVLCCVSLTFPVFADNNADSKPEPHGTKIVLSFKDGSDIVKVNGQDTKAEKSFSSKGVLLSPLKVLADAFSAQLTVSNNKTAVLKYNGMTMQFTVGNKDALIDGKKVPMPEAPQLANNSFMVPLRFVAENLGATVTVDKATSSIIVTKDIAGDNSIKDFSLILKKTSKERVGDSYYNWSIALPKNVNISYRNFSGSYNVFEDYDGSYSLYLGISDLKDETLDTLLSDRLNDTSGTTMISQSKETINGQEFMKVIFKDAGTTYEDRAYIKDKRIYFLELEVYKYENYLNNKNLSAMLDSFNIAFLKDGKSEDLSDVNAAGYRPFTDKKYKWSINVLANWDKDTTSSKENETYFVDSSRSTDYGSNLVAVKMYSKEAGLTLDTWVQKDISNIKDQFNTKYVNVLGIDDLIINGIKAKQVRTSALYGKKTLYSYYVYLIGTDYKYKIYYSYNSETDIDTMNRIGAIANSFKFTDPDSKSIGQLLDTEYMPLISGVRKIDNKDEVWSFDMPLGWTISDEDKDGKEVIYEDSKNFMAVTVTIVKDAPFSDFTKAMELYLSDPSYGAKGITLDKTETIQDKGTTVKVFHYTAIIDDVAVKQRLYILEKNNKLYLVTFTISDYTDTAKNEATLDTIWQSFKFE